MTVPLTVGPLYSGAKVTLKSQFHSDSKYLVCNTQPECFSLLVIYPVIKVLYLRNYSNIDIHLQVNESITDKIPLHIYLLGNCMQVIEDSQNKYTYSGRLYIALGVQSLTN